MPTPTNSQTNGDSGEDKQADKQLVVERVPAPEPRRRSRGVAENDCDARNQRRGVGQEEQDADEMAIQTNTPTTKAAGSIDSR